jgi:serine/threonine protein phosphatase PrpC
MPWTFNAATDIGSRSEQQDRLDILHSNDGRQHLIVLADGMGGLKNGAQAAQILVDVAAQHFAVHETGSAYTFLHNIFLAAHHAINDLPESADAAVGTTGVLLSIDNQRAVWAHVGDSRLYHFRNSRLLNHTKDHSLRQLMLAKGLVDEDSSAAKSMQNQLYMRLGGELLPEPDFNSTDVKQGDVFLLCSDGFWQAVLTDEILTTLEKCPSEQNAAKYLVDVARLRSGNRCDNISLAMAQWQGSTAQKYWHRLRLMLSSA